MEINWYTLSRQWFDFSFENPDKVNCSHTALYFYIIDKWNRFWQKEKFGLPSYYTMEELWIKSRKTYYKIFKDLVDFWFIEIIQESVNQNTSTIIKLNLTKNEWWKSKLDDAMCLLNNYSSNDTSTYSSNDTSTYPSRGTIDKQINKRTNKQINNNIVVSKETTLQDYIKKEFTIDFLTEIYNKYNLDKEIFKEECEAFVWYWTETNINWSKEKWQKEKTFDPKLRFRQWMKNTNRWTKTNLYNKPNWIWQLLD